MQLVRDACYYSDKARTLWGEFPRGAAHNENAGFGKTLTRCLNRRMRRRVFEFSSSGVSVLPGVCYTL